MDQTRGGNYEPIKLEGECNVPEHVPKNTQMLTLTAFAEETR